MFLMAQIENSGKASTNKINQLFIHFFLILNSTPTYRSSGF